MNTRDALLRTAFTAAAVLLAFGCNRQEPVPPGAPAAPQTSVGTQIDRVLTVARGVEGVQGVDNKMSLKK